MKTRVILLVLTMLLVISLGCSRSSDSYVVCESVETTEEESLTTIIKATIEDDKITKMTGTFTFDDEESAKSFYNLLSMRERNLDGKIAFNHKIDGYVVTAESVEYLYNDMANDDSVFIGSSKKDYISSMQKKGFDCK